MPPLQRLIWPLAVSFFSSPTPAETGPPLSLNQQISRLLIVPARVSVQHPNETFAGVIYTAADTSVAKTVTQIHELNEQLKNRCRFIAVDPHAFLSHVEYLRPLVDKRKPLEEFLHLYLLHLVVEGAFRDPPRYPQPSSIAHLNRRG